MLSSWAIFSRLHALWRALQADGEERFAKWWEPCRKGVPSVRGWTVNVSFALSAERSLCCPLDRAARWPNICLEISNGKQARQSSTLEKPGAWIGLLLLCGMVSAERGWVDPLWGQHKEISKPMSLGMALSSVPSSLAQSRAITQACAASGCVCFKPICREKQLSSLGKKKCCLVLYLCSISLNGI